MSLKGRLLRRIAAQGPMSVREYMWACLHDPNDGYYARRPSLGEGGDFLTAPLLSQVFGETLGVWAALMWRALGRPSPYRLVELGPGDGALLEDFARAARLEPGFREAGEVWLVETSPVFRALQEQRLAPLSPRFAASLEAVPSGAPLLVIANEFLDCFPVRQLLKTDHGWRERVVGAEGERLIFGLAPAPEAVIPEGFRRAPAGTPVEIAESQAAFARGLGERLARDGGAALLIDYGRLRPETGWTLQALRRHERQDPLEDPGEADLTVHVDFAAVAEAALHAPGLRARGGVQARFLAELGADLRFQRLAAARPECAARLARQRERLMSSDHMGELFKALEIAPAWAATPAYQGQTPTLDHRSALGDGHARP